MMKTRLGQASRQPRNLLSYHLGISLRIATPLKARSELGPESRWPRNPLNYHLGIDSRVAILPKESGAMYMPWRIGIGSHVAPFLHPHRLSKVTRSPLLASR
jgi:hypothetical protein